jgi:serine/threonine-protein kinase
VVQGSNEAGPPEPRPHEPAGSPGRGGTGPVSLFDYPRLLAGTWLLDRYCVVEKIGEGGFGYVYLVRDQSIGEEVILKILAPQISLDESMIKRFVHELKYNRRIVHPNVIRLYDFLDLNPGHAISMEYFPSEDLGLLLARAGRLEADRLLRLTAQLCRGLKAAHDTGIVHRDIKPPNILVGENDRTKIVDFGLAAASGMNQSRVTKSGLLVGTPQYMAPEQIRGAEVDHRTDIYALGALLYECLCGVPPFESDNPVSVLMMHLTDPVPSIRERAPDVPAVLEWLIETSLAKDPADRPQSVGDVLAEIEKQAA